MRGQCGEVRTDGQVTMEEDGQDGDALLREVGKVDEAGKCLTVPDKLGRFLILFQSLPDLNLIIVIYFLTILD